MRRINSDRLATPLLARITVRFMWMIAMTLITTTAIGCALAAYGCLSSLIVGQWYTAGGLAGLSLAGAIGATLLCRHRGDLVGDLSRI